MRHFGAWQNPDFARGRYHVHCRHSNSFSHGQKTGSRPILTQGRRQGKSLGGGGAKGTRAEASLSLPGGQDRNISSILPHFPVGSLIFPQIFFIFFLIFVLPGGRAAHPGRPWLLHWKEPRRSRGSAPGGGSGGRGPWSWSFFSAKIVIEALPERVYPR